MFVGVTHETLVKGYCLQDFYSYFHEYDITFIKFNISK